MRHVESSFEFLPMSSTTDGMFCHPAVDSGCAVKLQLQLDDVQERTRCTWTVMTGA